MVVIPFTKLLVREDVVHSRLDYAHVLSMMAAMYFVRVLFVACRSHIQRFTPKPKMGVLALSLLVVNVQRMIVTKAVHGIDPVSHPDLIGFDAAVMASAWHGMLLIVECFFICLLVVYAFPASQDALPTSTAVLGAQPVARFCPVCGRADLFASGTDNGGIRSLSCGGCGVFGIPESLSCAQLMTEPPARLSIDAEKAPLIASSGPQTRGTECGDGPSNTV